MSAEQVYLIVRFYGRFVFVESRKRDSNETQITALAINMDRVNAPPHAAFLAVREADVLPDTLEYTLEPKPTYRVVPCGDGERLLWNTTGCKIEIPGVGGFRWLESGDQSAPIVNLAEWTDRRFNPVYLDSVRPEAATTSVIQMGGGVGAGRIESVAAAPKIRLGGYQFVRYGGQEVLRSVRALADMVQIDIMLPDDSVDVVVNNHNHLRMKLNDRTSDSTKSVEGRSVRAITMHFSNLCANCDESDSDKEFAAYYEIFEPPPPLGQRVVPVLPDRLARLGRPFGDCYVSAKLTYGSSGNELF